MKLNNLSAKKICRLVSAGMVFSMLVITGIFRRYNAGYTNFHSGWNIDTLCIFLDLAIGAVFWKTPFSFYF